MKISKEKMDEFKKAAKAMEEYCNEHPEAIKLGMELVFKDAQNTIREYYNKLPLKEQMKLINKLKEIEYDTRKSGAE